MMPRKKLPKKDKRVIFPVKLSPMEQAVIKRGMRYCSVRGVGEFMRSASLAMAVWITKHGKA